MLIEKEDHIIYNNYRCRKCGNIISRELYYKDKFCTVVVNDVKFHNCPEGLEMDKGENIYLDNIGYSDEPLSNTYEIIKTKNPPTQ